MYHHAITSAAARARTQQLMAEATADGLAARATKARPTRVGRWSRLLAGRPVRVMMASVRRATT